jgi:hypothetical protein
MQCLTVNESSALPDGSRTLVGLTCDGRDAQRISTTDLEWRAMGNMCLKAEGGAVELDFCDGSAEQRWNFWDADPASTMQWEQIQSVATGQCVARRTAEGLRGEELTFATCSPTDQLQRFRLLGRGFIGAGTTGLCLDVFYGQPVPGRKVGLWDGCLNTLTYNSIFYVSGRLKSLGDCVSILGEGDRANLIGAQACDSGRAQQVWDYYF